MSYAHRQTILPSHVRPSSGLAHTAAASTQSALLQSRINEKKVELENLRQLRDLSAGLAGQMQQLEEKLATLSNGTEAVAAVLSNWHNVLRAISMASGRAIAARHCTDQNAENVVAKLPTPKDGEDESDATPLPQTLVRIPIHQANAMQRDAEAAAAAEET